MIENLQVRDVALEAALQYGGEYNSSLNADARRVLYKYAVDNKNIWDEMARTVIAEGSGVVLDVGTGSAPLIRGLVEQQYRGPIHGIDINEGHFSTAELILKDSYPDADIGFSVASATELPFDESSVDVVVAAFLIYHLSKGQQQAFLEESHRVLKPGGILLISSRDAENHERLWRLGGYMADRLDMELETFYSNCDLAATRELISDSFKVDEDHYFLQNCELKIPEDGWLDYYWALHSLRKAMHSKDQAGISFPSAKELDWLISTDIEKIFKQEIHGLPGLAGKGYFTDAVKQGFFVGRNIK